MVGVQDADYFNEAPDGSGRGPGWYFTEWETRKQAFTFAVGPFATEEDALNSNGDNPSS